MMYWMKAQSTEKSMRLLKIFEASLLLSFENV